jgi:hypothetical protein
LEEHGIHWDRVANGNVRLFSKDKDVASVAKPNRSSRLLVVQATIQRKSTSTYAAFDDAGTEEKDKAMQWHPRMGHASKPTLTLLAEASLIPLTAKEEEYLL